MKYTYEQRLDIGRQLYEGKLTRYQAAEQFGLCDSSVRSYMRLYRNLNHLPPRDYQKASSDSQPDKTSDSRSVSGLIDSGTLESYEAMSKEDLIKELIKARIKEARLKKGYEMKGDGSVIYYTNKNTR